MKTEPRGIGWFERRANQIYTRGLLHGVMVACAILGFLRWWLH